MKICPLIYSIEIQAYAEARGESVNGFLNRATESQMEAGNGAQMPSVAAQQLMLPETVEAVQQATGETMERGNAGPSGGAGKATGDRK